MKTITISVHPDWECEVVGELRESLDVGELSQSMVQINMLPDMTIEVGWEPEGDPNGSYEITFSRGLQVIQEWHRESGREAGRLVERIMTYVMPGITPTSGGNISAPT